MGIRTYPGYQLFGADCGYFWPSGQTPKKLYASFQGIKPGSSIPPSTYPCPNGIYRLEQVSGVPCKWSGYYGLGHIIFVMTALGNVVDVWTPSAESAFSGSDGLNSVFWFSNKLPGTAKFTGGYCYIMPRPGVYDIPSLAGVDGLVSGSSARGLLSEPFPVADGSVVVKYCDRRDHTNVKIKVDPSLF